MGGCSALNEKVRPHLVIAETIPAHVQRFQLGVDRQSLYNHCELHIHIYIVVYTSMSYRYSIAMNPSGKSGGRGGGGRLEESFLAHPRITRAVISVVFLDHFQRMRHTVYFRGGDGCS